MKKVAKMTLSDAIAFIAQQRDAIYASVRTISRSVNTRKEIFRYFFWIPEFKIRIYQGILVSLDGSAGDGQSEDEKITVLTDENGSQLYWESESRESIVLHNYLYTKGQFVEADELERRICIIYTEEPDEDE